MKSRFMRLVMLSGVALASPVLIFAAGQPKLHMLSQSEMQDLNGATPAIQQGKGGGLSRKAPVPSASDYHLATAKDLPAAPRQESGQARPKLSDSALRK